MEGLDAAVVVGGPAAVLVAADFALEPVHEKVDSQQFTVQSRRKKESEKITQRRPDRVGAGAEHRDSERTIGKS